MSSIFAPTFDHSNSGSRLGFNDGTSVFIQAGGNMASQFLCLGVLESAKIVLATDCLECGYKQLFMSKAGSRILPTDAVLINGLPSMAPAAE
jgi:hypothetical protein